MGWLGNVLHKVAGSSQVEMTLLGIDNPAPAGFGDPITPDECYVELYVESLRLKQARRFATKFNGVVYSFVSLAREGDANAEFAAASKPEKLAQLDAGSLDKVITVSKQMLAAVPWRGGNFSLQLGLFSVKSGNLLTPIIDYVTRVSSVAGISFVGVVKPFVPLITEGMDLIAGQKDDTAIEVAIDADIALQRSGIYAIIAAPKGSIAGQLSVDAADRKLLVDGHPLERAYCVFSIRRTLQKADYGEIPELKERYAAVQAAIKGNKIKDAQDALTAFRLATIASPDLISSDARRLVAKAEQKVKDAFPAGGVSLTQRVVVSESLSDIGLYH